MKLLFDQNISFRIVKLIQDKFPNAGQVRELKLEGKSDFEIWNYAKVNHFTIITFDADFYNFSNLYGHPPKIIWLRTGNTKTINIANLLNTKAEIINIFFEDKEISCLEIL